MKKILLFVFLFVSFTASADHLKGGFFTYEYLGPGINNPSYLRYHVRLTVYMICNPSPGQLGADIPFTFFDAGTGQIFQNVSVPRQNNYNLIRTQDEECISDDQRGCYYHIVVYDLPSIELPDNGAGYVVSYQRCCRITGIDNMQPPSNAVGSTYAIKIPGKNTGQNAHQNRSASFLVNDTSVVCGGSYFEAPFVAIDPDGDSLVYSFCNAWSGGGQGGGNGPNSSTPNPAAAPSSFNPLQYPGIPYAPGYGGSSPLGTGVTIDQRTGIIKGIAPSAQGEYVVTVCVQEYRQGVLIASSRKELHLVVGDCIPINATLNPEYITCDGFSQIFSNNTPSPSITSYFWDFGVPGRNDDTSNIAVPTWDYAPDTGVYTIKLVVNRGQACADSATAIVRVFPGFFPDFDIAGVCATKPTQFIDRTATNYGVVNTWRWDFGDGSTNADTSRLQNPTYSYPAPGTYNVRFIVTNSKGCIDTVPRSIQILDKPPISARFKDTLICRGDQLQLEAIGTGNFSWTPTTSIVSGANTATPIVNPTSTTSYIVQLDDNGCLNWDTVKVNVVSFVTLSGMPDTTICHTDSVQLRIISDGLQFVWTPSSSLNNPNIKNPTALPPPGTTNYMVTATIGGCSETADISVTTIPYPVVNAGPPLEICFGTSTPINASMTASSFTWTPTTGLNNPNILNPTASPLKTTAYILTVTDTLGCPKPVSDTVVVTVRSKMQVSAGRDTAVVIGQPLQLGATGGTNYLWVPSTGLNNPNIANPKAVYDGSFEQITYKVYIQDDFPCRDSASVTVRVFKTNPQIFVPTAFTPNGDRKNDRFTFVPVGISKIDYFRVYNRWGQLVYSSVSPYPGWDGKIGGQEQGSGVFVWIVKGSDFTGKVVTAKGTVTLIR